MDQRAWLLPRCAAMVVAVLPLAVWSFGGLAAQPQKRFFTVLAVEPKGGTTEDKEPFPAEPLPSGGGYEKKPPGENGRWQVSAYVWSPAQIIVQQGDEVTLEFVGINGAAHPTTIAAFGQSFTLKRGEAHQVTFTADKVGAFGIVCGRHRPSMSGELIVLPKQ